MIPESSRPRRGLPLTLRLTMALTVACFFVAMLVAFLGAERQGRLQVGRGAKQQFAFAHDLAKRLAPMLARDDLLRMSMLATAAQDQADARILILDHGGRVAIDTALAFGDRQLGLLTPAGAFQRINDQQLRESLVPVIHAGRTIGEIRVQCAQALDYAAFDLGLFLMVFLSCLSIVAVAALMGHHWSGRVREVTDSLVQLATGQLTNAKEPAADVGEFGQLGQALQEVEKGMHDGLSRVVDAFVALAQQVVDNLERRGLVPAGHGERTMRYAALLAEQVQLLPADRRDLELACRLHDLGKAWVRPAILQKRGQLDRGELESLRNHPVLAAEHLGCLPGLRLVATIIRHQFERHDGSGTPASLRGARIPLGSRILAIASAFDLLTTCGERRPLDCEGSLAQMAADCGEWFDPWLFELFADRIRQSPPAVANDRPVMITPADSVPYRLAAGDANEEELDYGLGQELEVMIDEMEQEERQ